MLNDFQRKTQFLRNYSNLITKNQLDWLIRNHQTNGLSKAGALAKVSGQWYVHVGNFSAWFAQQAV